MTALRARVSDSESRRRKSSLSLGKTECTYEGHWGRLIVELTPKALVAKL